MDEHKTKNLMGKLKTAFPYLMSKCFLDLQILLALLATSYFFLFVCFYSLLADFLDRYTTTVIAPISWVP